MAVVSVVVRQRVDDLDAAIPIYETLTGAAATRFAFGEAELASVGPFLLFRATGEEATGWRRLQALSVVSSAEWPGPPWSPQSSPEDPGDYPP